MRAFAPLLAAGGLVVQIGCGDSDRSLPTSAALLWEDTFDGGEASLRFADTAVAVATCAGRVFAVGNTTPDTEFQSDAVLRVYAAEDGELLWRDRIDSGAGDRAGHVACDDTRVYVTVAIDEDVRLLRAYDVETGAQVWSRESERLGNSYGALAIDGATLFFYEPAARAIQNGSVAVLQALNASSGTVRWEATDTVPMPEWSNGWGFGGLAIAASNVCAGSDFEEAEIRKIQCFDKANGALRWQDELGHLALASTVTPRSGSGQSVIVTTGARSGHTFLRAYEADTGEHLWDHDYPANAYVGAIESSGERILVSGVEFIVGREPYDERDVLFTEAFAAATGEPLWEDRRFDEQDAASALDRGRVIVASTERHVRIYDVGNGRLLIEQPSSISIQDVAAGDGRYFVAGTASSDSQSNGDFAVVAYSIR